MSPVVYRYEFTLREIMYSKLSSPLCHYPWHTALDNVLWLLHVTLPFPLALRTLAPPPRPSLYLSGTYLDARQWPLWVLVQSGGWVAGGVGGGCSYATTAGATVTHVKGLKMKIWFTELPLQCPPSIPPSLPPLISPFPCQRACLPYFSAVWCSGCLSWGWWRI